MNNIEQNLANWGASLFRSIPIADLLARNPVAYKWKAMFRSWMLREAVLWRLHDLLTQSYALHQQGHLLGARILLRGGFESTATLIYLNQLMSQVLAGTVRFHEFSAKTGRLLLGSKNRSTDIESVNIVTVLQQCDKRYPGIYKMYGELSESAHPSYEGLCIGYSKVHHNEYETIFSNRWAELHGDQHLGMVDLCMQTFHHEYNDVWPDLTGKLENWIEANDAELEATKGKV